MDRRGQASAAVNSSRWGSGDRAVNGCAMVPVGSGAREGPTHGVSGSGKTVAIGRRRWRCGSGERARGESGRAWWGGGKKPRQALKARRLRHAERTVLPAVAQRKKGGGREGVAAGCGVCCAVLSVGGDGGGGEGGLLLVRAGVRACCPVCCARCAVSGGGGRSTDIRSEVGPQCVLACGGVGVCPAT